MKFEKLPKNVYTKMNVLTTLSISRPIVAVISVMQQSNSLFNLN